MSWPAPSNRSTMGSPSCPAPRNPTVLGTALLSVDGYGERHRNDRGRPPSNSVPQLGAVTREVVTVARARNEVQCHIPRTGVVGGFYIGVRRNVQRCAE